MLSLELTARSVMLTPVGVGSSSRMRTSTAPFLCWPASGRQRIANAASKNAAVRFMVSSFPARSEREFDSERHRHVFFVPGRVLRCGTRSAGEQDHPNQDGVSTEAPFPSTDATQNL